MKSFFFAAAALALLATPAFAKRHCVKEDGSEIADAHNKKACKTAGGHWKKMKKGDHAMDKGAMDHKGDKGAMDHKGDKGAMDHKDAAPAAAEPEKKAE